MCFPQSRAELRAGIRACVPSTPQPAEKSRCRSRIRPRCLPSPSKQDQSGSRLGRRSERRKTLQRKRGQELRQHRAGAGKAARTRFAAICSTGAKLRILALLTIHSFQPVTAVAEASTGMTIPGNWLILQHPPTSQNPKLESVALFITRLISTETKLLFRGCLPLLQAAPVIRRGFPNLH